MYIEGIQRIEKKIEKKKNYYISSFFIIQTISNIGNGYISWIINGQCNFTLDWKFAWKRHVAVKHIPLLFSWKIYKTLLIQIDWSKLQYEFFLK